MSICLVLGETEREFMTSRGYRAAKTRKPSEQELQDGILIEIMKDIHQANYGVYGVRKVWRAMRRAGWDIGRDRVNRLMTKAGLSGVRRGRTPFTTVPTQKPDHRPDLMDWKFTAQGPNELWVADITYVRTTSGFCYTAFVTDVFSRKFVG